ncbi:hypothetical protein DWG24_13195 [Dickeya zeae]|uniref:Uncharacterized protein n=1 Tax=Dickeya zeae TaxID=204042 RepID=A0AAE6Z135_9GAMM|nr:hypothetical protein DWG24_13195 [Dickeya zeae]
MQVNQAGGLTPLYAIADALQITLTSYTPLKRKICVSRHLLHLPVLKSIDYRSFLHHIPAANVLYPVMNGRFDYVCCYYLPIYTRHTSSCRCVGGVRSPESLT